MNARESAERELEHADHVANADSWGADRLTYVAMAHARAGVLAAIATAEQLERIADVLCAAGADGRIRVDVSGATTSYSVEP